MFDGRLPVKLFSRRSIISKEDMLNIELGIGPFRELLLMFNCSKSLRLPICAGISPAKSLKKQYIISCPLIYVKNVV